MKKAQKNGTTYLKKEYKKLEGEDFIKKNKKNSKKKPLKKNSVSKNPVFKKKPKKKKTIKSKIPKKPKILVTATIPKRIGNDIDGRWQCKVCSFKNNKDLKICGTCKEKKQMKFR